MYKNLLFFLRRVHSFLCVFVDFVFFFFSIFMGLLCQGISVLMNQPHLWVQRRMKLEISSDFS